MILIACAQDCILIYQEQDVTTTSMLYTELYQATIDATRNNLHTCILTDQSGAKMTGALIRLPCTVLGLRQPNLMLNESKLSMWNGS